MKNQLLEKWAREELIGLNCLSKRSGAAVLLNSISVEIEGERKHFCQPVCDTTIENLEKYDDDIWTEVQGFASCTDNQTGFTYIGGEGGMGNEGFVLCLDQNKEPEWALFFVNSNPFYQLAIKDGKLEAVSSLDLKYTIDLDSPEKIEILHFEWKG